MSKKDFFLDFDGTIVNSIKAYCNVYNFLYRNHDSFIPADWTKVNTYNFINQCPLAEDVEEIFSHPLFFRILEFINENTYEILQELSDKYRLISCSIGTPKNIAMKAQWLELHIPFIKDYVLIRNQGCKMNKSIINMKGAIFGDDIPSNLKSSNAKDKFLFGQIYPWNNDWQGKHCFNWNSIKNEYL